MNDKKFVNKCFLLPISLFWISITLYLFPLMHVKTHYQALLGFDYLHELLLIYGDYLVLFIFSPYWFFPIFIKINWLLKPFPNTKYRLICHMLIASGCNHHIVWLPEDLFDQLDVIKQLPA